MNPIEQAFTEIESEALSLQLNLASSVPALIRALQGTRPVTFVLNQMRNDEVRRAVLVRFLDRIREPFDQQYEHPHDIAVAIYVWLLSVMDWQNSRSAALLGSHIPQSWWARKLSTYILHSSDATQTDASINIVRPTGTHQYQCDIETSSVVVDTDITQMAGNQCVERSFISSSLSYVLFDAPPYSGQSSSSKYTIV